MSTWYDDRRKELRAIARNSGRSLATIAGIAAALSPRVPWPVNLRDATRIAHNPRARKIAGIRSNVAKARKIARGARPLDVLSGPKVRSFYRALMGDETAVCIDSHVYNAWAGLGPTTETPHFSERTYNRIAGEIIDIARYLGITPIRLQAEIWERQRERQRGKQCKQK